MFSTAVMPEKFIPAPLVLECVASFFAVSVADLRGPVVSFSLSRARGIATLLLLEHSMLSQVEVGLALGRKGTSGRDFLVAARKLGEDQRFTQMLEQVRQRLTDGGGHG